MAKIQNISIDIKVGKKEYKLKNLILDVYLNRFVKGLIQDYNTNKKSQRICLVKLDKPIKNINPDMQIPNNTFDLALFEDKITEEISTNKITTKYNWSNYIYDYVAGKAPHAWNEYKNRKICTLGFNYNFGFSLLVGAIIDVSNYDIYVEEGQDIYITRIDTVSTDAVFSSSDTTIIKAPVHLMYNGIPGILPTQEFWDDNHLNGRLVNNNAYAKLTNIGLSNSISIIEKYLDLSNYIEDNNVFRIKKLNIPEPFFPSKKLFPSEIFFPNDTTYKYLVLKFDLYQEVDEGDYANPIPVEKYLDKWYYHAIPLKDRGILDLNIKYERG